MLQSFAGVRKVVFAAAAVSCLHPVVTGPIALGLGLLFALSLGVPWQERIPRLSKSLLQWSVIGLGFGFSLGSVIEAGISGIGYTILGIAVAIGMGNLLGKWLRVESGVSSLITFGTAICGGSAIAALSPVVGARSNDIAIALAVVFTLNAIGLFVFPWVGHELSLTQEQFGLWSALAIHDTSSVVGACGVYGGVALAVGTATKLSRALWIAPLTLAFAFMKRGAGKKKVTIPWFIFFFVGAAAVRSLLPQLEYTWNILSSTAKQALVLCLFLIGSGVKGSDIRNSGLRPFLQGILLWVFLAGASLLLILKGG